MKEGTNLRIAALDVGEKRIGIALSDAFGWTAQGLETYSRLEESKDCEYIAGLLEKKGAQRIVVGLPVNMDGSLGRQAEYVQAFAKALSAHTDLPVEFWDERLSTAAARRTLLEADVSRKKRKKVIDKMAAAHILQGYLDRRHNE
jgi:putative Holliday junction resolvase